MYRIAMRWASRAKPADSDSDSDGKAPGLSMGV
jgi:hypothetical protein